MNIAPEKREWLCIIPDKPGMLEKRLEIRPTHLANLKPLIESKQVVTGGPMFHDAHPTEGKPANFKGSMMIFRAATEAEVREILSNDVYGKGNVWDLENMQIIPVAIVV
ncbi:hypothetical protein TCE0_034f09911 [Talaromyces pinophilus]|uniref:YCII-related domain-containing protein n=1 Tax=Talaromyces pinophilus TaxID=128442 RepID=A0A6V8HBL8_TALPI|nr:hypothetical protein DPV78_001888 [Talaromyces pinophilus]PCH04756.1 hypothetical protein PENOC_032030 [Penicillium occitanis (nom. inval.)]PCH04867.1 YCII-related [Penicillium occitanis (nom. inval.)]GAM38847.1 hypothetical protein TCE0_034f09911 [Talaromyces pinophilus]